MGSKDDTLVRTAGSHSVMAVRYCWSQIHDLVDTSRRSGRRLSGRPPRPVAKPVLLGDQPATPGHPSTFQRRAWTR